MTHSGTSGVCGGPCGLRPASAPPVLPPLGRRVLHQAGYSWPFSGYTEAEPQAPWGSSGGVSPHLTQPPAAGFIRSIWDALGTQGWGHQVARR